MKQRIGGLLCLALGAVLIFGGVGFGAAGAVGTVQPTTTVTTTAPPVDPCIPSVRANRGVAGYCARGSITITEVTVDNGQTPPESWSVTLDSANCTLPGNDEPTHSIANNGSTTYDDLFVYTNSDRTEQCTYTLSTATVAKYDATFTPAGPYTFSDEFNQNTGKRAQPRVVGLAQPVVLTITGQQAATSSAAPSPTLPSEPGASLSAPVSSADAGGGAASSSSAPVLAETGPHGPVRGSLIAGIALCLFGGVLLIAGQRPRRARHR
jgi:hypothetical protein